MIFRDSDIPFIEDFDLDMVPRGSVQRFWLKIVTDGMGTPVCVPLLVARGQTDGKVLGITAAVHGNELNGIPVIQRLFATIDATQLTGTVIGVPVVNVPSYVRFMRRFPDETDLNQIMPGKADGNISQVYAARIISRIVRHFDYLLDLHTASVGRINSYYIRANMSDPTVSRMASLQNAEIVVHNLPSDGTLRGAAEEMGIPAITLEVGNPNVFQKGKIKEGLTGIRNLLLDFGFLPGEMEEHDTHNNTIFCSSSFWIYTHTGGVLQVHPGVTDYVKEGEVIATMRNIFGDVIKQYLAPRDGIVIGRSVHPVAQSGARILHLGVVG